MTTGLLVVAAVLVLGTGLGLWRRRTDGRFHSTASPITPAASRPAPTGSAAAGASAPAGSAPPAVRPTAPTLPTKDLAPAPQTPTGTIEATQDGSLPIAGLAQAGPPTGAGIASAATTTPGRADADPGSLTRELQTELGIGPADATLLQFSSAFCAPCRALRRVSSEVAAMLPGVRHVEVDAESHLEAVRALGIWRTPTLLVLDRDGRVVKRATGVPGKAQLIAVLGQILPESRPDQR